MKKLLFPTLLFCGLFAGCKKDDPAPPTNAQKIQAHPWKANRFSYLQEGKDYIIDASTRPCLGGIIWTFSVLDMERKGYETCDLASVPDPGDVEVTKENYTKPYELVSGQKQIRTFDNAGRENIYDILTLTADTLLLNSNSQRGPLDPVFHLEFIRQ